MYFLKRPRQVTLVNQFLSVRGHIYTIKKSTKNEYVHRVKVTPTGGTRANKEKYYSTADAR